MTTIKLKNGSGAPLATDLVQGEVALDLANKRIYSENAAGAVIEMGTSPSTIDINAGTIDGTVIGGASAAAGTFTTANATTVDTTNIEVTNVKAKDGTASATIADSTGVMTIASSVLTTTDINGGTIDGVTIGGASAGAGTFTTLNTTGSVVFNEAGADVDFRVEGDTDANLLFVDASTDRVGVGTNAPAVKVQIGSGAAAENIDININGGTDANLGAGIAFLKGGTSFGQIANFGRVQGGTSNDFFITSVASNALIFGISQTERMRITTAGNVGIGTTSPSQKLSVEGNMTLGALAGGGRLFLTSSTGFSPRLEEASNALAIYTNNTERMRITSSGNVGINTSSPANELEVKSTGGSSIINITDSGGIRARIQKNAGDGSLNIFNESEHYFSFGTNNTERLRITSSGNVGIGTTSPASKLDVSGDVTITDKIIHSGDTNTAIRFPAADTVTVETAGTERLRIDSSGNVGIGTTSPAHLLDIGNTSIQTTEQRILSQAAAGTARLIFKNDTSVAGNVLTTSSATVLGTGGMVIETTSEHPIVFRTNSSGVESGGNERMRIDSSGNLLVGTTSSLETNLGARLMSDGAVRSTRSQSTGAASTLDVYSTGASAFRFYVDMAGTVFATNTSISAISDVRHKENIRDLDVGLAEVMQLQPRVFDWKEGKGKNKQNDRGFIAQEFEQVFPDLIDEWKDPSPDGEEPYKSVRQDLIPVLVKAIQEQQAIIDSLKSRLDAAGL